MSMPLNDLEELGARLAPHRHQGRRIVLTNGCFDLLHAGHVAYLRAARALGDLLVVGVNSDASVRRLKGPGRPLNRLEDRMAVLDALRCVDQVIAFDGDTPAELVRAVRPGVLVKGGDYRVETLPEARLVAELGGEVVLLPYLEGRSASGLLRRLRELTART
jgi:D-beta-D-heptose 7-phosphate kinase / D-beta-D-heptose 1-phosphate adenosyltransferase